MGWTPWGQRSEHQGLKSLLLLMFGTTSTTYLWGAAPSVICWLRLQRFGSAAAASQELLIMENTQTQRLHRRLQTEPQRPVFSIQTLVREPPLPPIERPPPGWRDSETERPSGPARTRTASCSPDAPSPSAAAASTATTRGPLLEGRSSFTRLRTRLQAQTSKT